MKRFFIIIVLIIISALLYSQDNSGTKITENWIKLRKNLRTNYSSRKMVEFDKNSLNTIEKGTILSETETSLRELLYDIMVANMVEYPDNTIKALDILQKKFQNKKLYSYTVEEYAFHYPYKNPHIIVKIIKGLKELMSTNYEDVMKSIKVVYLSIKNEYIIQSNSGTIKYGAEFIATEIIAFIREYVALRRDMKIEEKNEHIKLLTEIYEDLNLEKGNFSKLSGAKELILEF